jgi:hypothetical protein
MNHENRNRSDGDEGRQGLGHQIPRRAIDGIRMD